MESYISHDTTSSSWLLHFSTYLYFILYSTDVDEMVWCCGATLTAWLLLVSEMKDGSIEKAINNFIDNNFLGEIEKNP